MSKIAYPYLPESRTILYVPANNPYMQMARGEAQLHSLDKTMPVGVVLVDSRTKKVIGLGANGSDYHEKNGCERVRLGCKSGQGYNLCEGCDPKNHGEIKGMASAREVGLDVIGAELYLWGHWWCCKDCWTAMLLAGIGQVYLMEGSEVLFNKDAPGNVVGRQFEI